MNGLMFMLAAVATIPASPAYHVERGIVYARPQGKPVRLDLYVPDNPGGKRRPAVVLVHGGAWMFGTRRQLGYYARRLAQEGYVCAAISYRMMPKHGFPACLHDCKSAVRWLRAHADKYGIEPGRIAGIGNSAGGHLVALLAATRAEDGLEGTENPGPPSTIQAAIVLYGVTDLSYYRAPRGYIRLAGFTRIFMERFVRKEQPAETDPYGRASPSHYVHHGCPPFLLVHGLRDGQVPYAQAVTFHEQLRRLAVPSRLVTLPYGHAYDYFHARIRDAVLEIMLAFLDAELGMK